MVGIFNIIPISLDVRIKSLFCLSAVYYLNWYQGEELKLFLLQITSKTKFFLCIIPITYFYFTCSLESPFKKILNTALKHEEKDYECPILSNACPFKNKQFIQKIELGQQKSKEFMDEMMETVISDLNKPLETGLTLHCGHADSK